MNLGTALGTGLLAGLSTALGLESHQDSGDGVTPWVSGWPWGQGHPTDISAGLWPCPAHGGQSAAHQSPHGESCSPQSSASTCSHSRCLSAGPAQSLSVAGACPGSLELG